MTSPIIQKPRYRPVTAIFTLIAIAAFAPTLALAQPAPIGVSINAGETYVIDHIKSGSVPAVRIIENPNALITSSDGPHKMLLLGTEAGRWAIDVTDNSGRADTYNVHVFAVAKPGKPLSPGKAAPGITDMHLAPRPGAGALSTETERGLPELARIHSAAPLPSYPDKSDDKTDVDQVSGREFPGREVPSQDASWSLPALPARAIIPAVSTQAVGKLETHNGEFRTDPSVLSESAYSTEAISGGKHDGHYLPDDAVSIMIGSSEVIDFKRRLTRISIADSKIADVQVINPFQLNLIGHQPGFTTIALWDSQGSYEERQIRVDPSGRQQVMLNTIIAELDRTGLENQGINLSVALNNYGLSFVSLPGAVAAPYSPNSSSPGAITTLPPGGSLIPMLLSQSLTYGISSQGNGVTTQTLFQFLEQHNLGRILAEPHLLANSGEKAKFLSGGEIPIVIAQALNSTIVFKQFGTSVEFIPTVVGRSDLELLVKPEVSEPDYAHGVQLFGFTVPAFVTRRAETLVRLKDRQTLIIAGLILHEKLATVQKVPYVGDVPYLGALFRNTYWQNKETDLVMSVTPEIVRPLPAAGDVFLPSNRGSFTSEEIRTKETNPPDPSRPRF